MVGLAAIGASFSNDIVQLSVLRGVWGLGNAMFFATAMVVLVNLANDREWVVGLRGIFMVLALAVAARRLREPTNPQPPVRLGAIFATYRRPAFVALCAVTAAYNFVFFVVLGYTPLFLGLDAADRRVATGAFNLVRWGAAAPAPIISGKLAEHGPALPFWVGLGVLAAGAPVYLATAHRMAAGHGERALRARWNRAAARNERAPEEPVGEAY